MWDISSVTVPKETTTWFFSLLIRSGECVSSFVFLFTRGFSEMNPKGAVQKVLVVTSDRLTIVTSDWYVRVLYWVTEVKDGCEGDRDPEWNSNRQFISLRSMKIEDVHVVFLWSLLCVVYSYYSLWLNEGLK